LKNTKNKKIENIFVKFWWWRKSSQDACRTSIQRGDVITLFVGTSDKCISNRVLFVKKLHSFPRNKGS